MKFVWWQEIWWSECALIACNYIVNLEKLGLADERTTQTVAFKS